MGLAAPLLIGNPEELDELEGKGGTTSSPTLAFLWLSKFGEVILTYTPPNLASPILEKSNLY